MWLLLPISKTYKTTYLVRVHLTLDQSYPMLFYPSSIYMDWTTQMSIHSSLSRTSFGVQNIICVGHLTNWGLLSHSITDTSMVGDGSRDATAMHEARIDIRKLGQVLQGQQFNPTKVICSKLLPLVLCNILCHSKYGGLVVSVSDLWSEAPGLVGTQPVA